MRVAKDFAVKTDSRFRIDELGVNERNKGKPAWDFSLKDRFEYDSEEPHRAEACDDAVPDSFLPRDAICLGRKDCVDLSESDNENRFPPVWN